MENRILRFRLPRFVRQASMQKRLASLCLVKLRVIQAGVKSTGRQLGDVRLQEKNCGLTKSIATTNCPFIWAEVINTKIL